MISTVFALEFESAAWRADRYRRLRVGVWTLGVAGRGSADILRGLIAQHRPELVISAGFSGALQTDLDQGAIVIGENYSEPRLVRAVQTSHPEFHIGPVLTAAGIIETSSEKWHLGMTTGALAGDLETEHLHQVCRDADIPMLSVRSISDTMSQSLPVPGSVLINPESGKSDPQAIMLHLFRNPTKIAPFIKLVRDAKSTQLALANALDSILPALLKS